LRFLAVSLRQARYAGRSRACLFESDVAAVPLRDRICVLRELCVLGV